MDKILIGKRCLLIIFLLIVIIIYCIINHSQKRTEIIITLKKVDLLKKPERALYSNDVIETLEKGRIGKILYVRYSKEYMFYKIRLENGTEGWILSHPKEIKLIDFSKK